jgi:hypothetical protein
MRHWYLYHTIYIVSSGDYNGMFVIKRNDDALLGIATAGKFVAFSRVHMGQNTRYYMIEQLEVHSFPFMEQKLTHVNETLPLAIQTWLTSPLK